MLRPNLVIYHIPSYSTHQSLPISPATDQPIADINRIADHTCCTTLLSDRGGCPSCLNRTATSLLTSELRSRHPSAVNLCNKSSYKPTCLQITQDRLHAIAPGEDRGRELQPIEADPHAVRLLLAQPRAVDRGATHARQHLEVASMATVTQARLADILEATVTV